MRTRGDVYLAGAALLALSLLVWPVVLLRARRPRPVGWRDEQRERNRLSVLLVAEGTEYPSGWVRRPREVA